VSKRNIDDAVRPVQTPLSSPVETLETARWTLGRTDGIHPTETFTGQKCGVLFIESACQRGKGLNSLWNAGIFRSFPLLCRMCGNGMSE
jgi:hypothetical protein